ncbi:acetyl esterase/lipase [Streptomyces sp. VMFN-G11Ma]|nr:acetyl esterase/lipase [Streptomyces sp. VMFN-G11Ma]
MALDEHAARLLVGLEQQGLPPFDQLDIGQVRQMIGAFTGFQLPAEPVGRFATARYSSDGHELALNIYVPAADRPLPVVLYLHGGGFVAGNLSVVDEPARALANASGVIVVTAQYRLAPEHKFPAASDDAWAALNWVAEHIADHGGDPERLLLMGDSAGGNLAAVTALRARDADRPRVHAQILISPAVDPNARFPSRSGFATGYGVAAADMDFFWASYLATSADALHPHAVPRRAATLAGLPPTLVLTTENEVVRDEAEDFGARLLDAGVDTHIIRFDGLIHGTYWMSAAVPRSRELRDAIAEFISRVTEPTSPAPTSSRPDEPPPFPLRRPPVPLRRPLSRYDALRSPSAVKLPGRCARPLSPPWEEEARRRRAEPRPAAPSAVARGGVRRPMRRQCGHAQPSGPPATSRAWSTVRRLLHVLGPFPSCSADRPRRSSYGGSGLPLLPPHWRATARGVARSCLDRPWRHTKRRPPGACRWAGCSSPERPAPGTGKGLASNSGQPRET